MSHPMCLANKHILFVGEETGVDNAIVNQLMELGGSVVKYNELDVNLIESGIKNIIKEEGSFDGLVFAIVHSDFRPLQFVKPDGVNKIMNDNFATFIEIVRSLKKNKGLNKGASIVALSSISSVRAMKAKMAFCSSKAALDAAVRCLAVELAPEGIRVNSIQKGSVDADLQKSHIQNVVAIRDSEETSQQPLGKTSAEEMANLVCFLLSDAVKTITGTSIALDGGYLA